MAALKNIWGKLEALETSTASIYRLQYESKLLAHVTHCHWLQKIAQSYKSYRLRVEFGACLVRTVWIDYDLIL